MTKITLKKTKEVSRTRYGSKGKIGVTPASYDIVVDGEKVGDIMGGCHSKLSCKSGYQKGTVKGASLSVVGIRGQDRRKMEQDILKILEKKAD